MYKLLLIMEKTNISQYILKSPILEGLKFLKFNKGIKDFDMNSALKKLEGDSL